MNSQDQILADEHAENESYHAAEQEGLITGEESSRRLFGLGFRFALGYLRFKESSPLKGREQEQ